MILSSVGAADVNLNVSDNGDGSVDVGDDVVAGLIGRLVAICYEAIGD